MSVYSRKESELYSLHRESYTATDKEVFSVLEKIGIADKNILDHGCGDGRYSIRLMQLGAGSVVGLDNSSAMIDMAKQRLQRTDFSNISFVQADGNSLPFPSEYFDLIFSNFVLHHLVPTNRPLHEISRVLKNNGYLVATFNTEEIKDKKLIGIEIPLILGKTDSVVVHNTIITDENISDNLKNSSLNILRYDEQNNPFLSMDPSFSERESVSKVKTMLLVAQK